MIVTYLKTENVNTAGFNPKSRTTKRQVKSLLARIKQHGILSPLHIGNDGILADGHRRLACAIEAGLEQVPVIVHPDMTSAQLWVALNADTLPVKPRTWLEAVYYGLPLEFLPTSEAAEIKELYRVAGDGLVEKLVKSGRSSYILRMAQTIGNYCDDKTDDFIKAAIEWMEDHAHQFKVRKAMDDGIDPETLHSAVTGNRPLREQWGLG